jgi:hypothetical protein
MSFWDNIIQPTPAMLLPPPENTPYDNVLGTATGLDPSINNAGAEAVHPSLSPDPNSPDRLSATAGEPAGFDLDPTVLTPNVFASWHTAFQEEYINRHKDANGFVTISGGGDPIHVTLSSTQDKVFILESLQKADFATMALVDQQRIATNPDFKLTATRLGLINGNGDVATRADVDGPGSLYDTTLAEIQNVNQPIPNILTPAEQKVFLDEMANIEAQIAKMGVYSPTDINAAIQAIKDRFERVQVFAQALRDPNQAEARSADDPNQFTNVKSLDGDATILRGFQAFMNSERQILAADNASLQISNTGTLAGLTKHLDAPNLVAAFQLGANLKDQAINAADTEEINQINDLLKTYNVMQELINQTIAAFDASKNEERRGLLGSIDTHKDAQDHDVGDITDVLRDKLNDEAKLKAVSMFEDLLQGAPSPIEKLLHVTRPAGFDFYNNAGKTLNYFQKPTWDQWSATIGNTVQQISQQNQITFNNINTLEKERTTHFQSATNALTKAVDITSTIGRNVA